MNEVVGFANKNNFPRAVEDYRSASLHGEPLIYPGERPDNSYVTDGSSVVRVDVSQGDEGLQFLAHSEAGDQSLDEYLADHNAPFMKDRIPVLAYGANMCPGSLLAKFQKVSRPDALVIPTIYSQLSGYDVVWSAGPGNNGNFAASLYKGPETVSTAVQVGINFLTREQLLVLHATELNYDVQRIEVPVDNKLLPVYFYAGQDEIFVENDQPVAVAAIPAEGRSIQAASTTEMLDKVLAIEEVKIELLPKLPENEFGSQQYVNYVKQLKEKPGDETPRSDLKQHFHSILAEHGMSRLNNTTSGVSVSRANPSTLPTYGEWLDGSNDGQRYVLPSSELPITAWPDREAREKVLRGLSINFHRHNLKN